MDMRLTKMWLPWIILRIRLPLYVGRTLVANAALEMLKYSRIRGKYPSEMIVQCCCYSALAACTCNYLLAFPTKGHKGHFLSLSRHLCLWLFLLRKDEFFHANTVLAAIAWLPKSLFSGLGFGRLLEQSHCTDAQTRGNSFGLLCSPSASTVTRCKHVQDLSGNM